MEPSPSRVKSEESDDPGAAPYGNFINYYTFNPPENRLSLIPRSLLEELDLNPARDGPVLLLDVGCNSGDLSVALYRHIGGEDHVSSGGGVHLLGIDLDPRLVLRAQNSNPFPLNVQFQALDITEEAESRALLGAHLRRWGHARFHLCVCLAVSMWVHLRRGDAALLELLSFLASVCQHLLLELQPWRCYRSAARRLRRLGRSDFQHFRELRICGDVEGHARDHLERQCGMQLVRSFGSTAWDRRLLLFSRKA